MKQFLQSSLLLAVVAAVLAQGYIGRQRNGHFVEPFNDGLSSLSGGGMANMPDHIQRIIGSTVTGEVLVGGMNGLPRHGGTLNENGLVDGWGMNPDEPASPSVSLWSDPLNGAGFPTNYNGEELVLDRVSNRYVVNSHGTGHQGASNNNGDQGGFPGGFHGGFPGEFNGGFQGQGGFVQDSMHNANKFGQLDYGRRTIG